MSKRIHQLLASLDSLTLSKQERSDSREVLQARMRYPHAFLTLESAASAFTLKSSEKLHARVELRETMHGMRSASGFRFLDYFSINRFIAMISASLALVGAGGGVLAYAAESALPGDLLYSVKVGVNEPVVTLLQHTPKEKARWAARKLERRMDEAVTLVMRAAPQQSAEARAKIRLERSDGSSASDTQAMEATVAAAARIAPPASTHGLTGKQQEALTDLLNAGVPDAKIQTWIRAVKGRREAPESNLLINLDVTNDSTSSSVSSSARSSPQRGKKKEIIRGVLESGFLGGAGSSKSRKNTHSSSMSAGALLSSDTADDSSVSSSTISSSRERSSLSSSSSSVLSSARTGSSSNSSAASIRSSSSSVQSSVSSEQGGDVSSPSSSPPIIPLPVPLPTTGNGFGL